jgi:hypothetical protein
VKICLDSQSSGKKGARSLLLVVMMIGSVVLQMGGLHVRRSDDAVRIAQQLGALERRTSLALEQAWRFGGKLYLPSATVFDLDPQTIATANALREATGEVTPDVVVLTHRSCEANSCIAVLASLGYALEERMFDYLVFRRISS